MISDSRRFLRNPAEASLSVDYKYCTLYKICTRSCTLFFICLFFEYKCAGQYTKSGIYMLHVGYIKQSDSFKKRLVLIIACSVQNDQPSLQRSRLIVSETVRLLDLCTT